MRILLAIATSLLLTLGVVGCGAPTAPLSEQESYTQLLTDLDELILAADQHYNTTLADQPGSAAGGYAVAYGAHLRNLRNSITEAGPSVDTEDEHTRRVDGWRAEIEGLGERFSRGENLGELEYVDASGGGDLPAQRLPR